MIVGEASRCHAQRRRSPVEYSSPARNLPVDSGNLGSDTLDITSSAVSSFGCYFCGVFRVRSDQSLFTSVRKIIIAGDAVSTIFSVNLFWLTAWMRAVPSRPRDVDCTTRWDPACFPGIDLDPSCSLGNYRLFRCLRMIHRLLATQWIGRIGPILICDSRLCGQPLRLYSLCSDYGTL